VPQTQQARPLVSVIMANYQAGHRIAHALKSVLEQTVTDIEVIASDDASGDDSVALVREAMAKDGRIKLIVADRNGGPAGARNRALDMAQGEWIAIVDSDDIIHHERFERLLAAAEHFGADVVADDLLHFHEDGAPVSFLLGEEQRTPFAVTPQSWIVAGIRPGTAPLGYLKPMIRANTLGALRYDEAVRIGEDYDLMLRVLLKGARFHVVPEPWYLYRRHSGSISYRLSVGDVAAMIENQKRLVASQGPFNASVQAALDERMEGLVASYRFEHLVAAIKQRDLGGTLKSLATNPALIGPLWRSFREGRSRRAQPGTVTERNTASELQLTGAVERSSSAYLVPPYIPVTAIDWTRSSQRQTWKEIADLASGGRVKVLREDEAARYAAGFIPGARLDLETRAGVPAQ